MDLVLGLESESLFDCNDVLLGRCSAAAAMCDIYGLPNFSFIPAPMNISDEEIPESAFASMINDVREDFDFIIIDSCAEMTDYYKKFARQADEAIIVTLHQTTSVRAAEKTASRLAAMGIKDLGLVVNGFRQNFAENGKLPSIIDIINRSSHEQKGLPGCTARLFVLTRTGENRNRSRCPDAERGHDTDHEIDRRSRDPDGCQNHRRIGHPTEHNGIDHAEHL